jgi:hypothetical protein
MILPSKKLSPENSIIFLGGKVLNLLDQPKTVSALWYELKESYSVNTSNEHPNYGYDWSILALDFLFIAGAIELSQGTLNRRLR